MTVRVRAKEEWSVSTISVDGVISNIVLHEQKFMNQINLFDDDRVICVSSNYATYFHPRPVIAARIQGILAKKARVSKSARQHQGTGAEFNSSIAVYITMDLNDVTSKIYKLKIFRTGTIDCLGILKADFSDFLPVVDVLTEFMERTLRTFEANRPMPKMLVDINGFLNLAGEREITTTRYIGPIKLNSLKVVLQNWLYHFNILPGQLIYIQAMVEYLKGSPPEHIKKEYDIIAPERTAAEVAAQCQISIYVVNTTINDSKDIKDIKIKFLDARPNIPVRKVMSSKISRYAKVTVNGLSDNNFVANVRRFYTTMEVKRFIVHAMRPDSATAQVQEDDDSDDEEDMEDMIARINSLR